MRMRSAGQLLHAVLLLAAALAAAPSCAQQAHMVFAHYMVTNQDYVGDDGHNQEAKIAGYEREIQQAQAIGIDGFALNVGGWLRETYYIRYTAEIFEAALRLHSGFKLMFSADMCCGDEAADVEDMMRRFAGNPRYRGIYFQHDHKFVLTTFAGDKLGVAGWQRIRSDLATGEHPSVTPEPNTLAEVAGPPSSAPLPIFFVPAFFWGGELPQPSAISAGLDQWRGALDGAFYWGIAGVPGSGGDLDQLHSSAAYATALHGAGKLYMAPVCLQFWGANANRYYEYSGGAGMGAMWKQAIETTHPEWVEIITWNDFIEGTYISPINDPNRYSQANFLAGTGVPAGTLGYFHDHGGADGLLRYYTRWYKTGVRPPIDRDQIYAFYRTQSKDTNAGKPPVAHQYGPVADVIYLTVLLRAPATLAVVSGTRITKLALPAGLTETSAAFVEGNRPAIQLRRGNRLMLSGEGPDWIQPSPEYNDFYYTTWELSRPRTDAESPTRR